VRPLISGLLPRQGIPPAIESWDAFAETLRWGRAAGAVPEPRRWWWELRPHVAFGTLKLRAPDAQTTIQDAAAVAAFAHALVGWLVDRHDSGERLGAPETRRIAENRWTACRDRLDGRFADLLTGQRRPCATCCTNAYSNSRRSRRGSGAPRAEQLVERNGALRQRAVAAQHGLRGLSRWLADHY
jgi:carboxylate-amine ligase